MNGVMSGLAEVPLCLDTQPPLSDVVQLLIIFEIFILKVH